MECNKYKCVCVCRDKDKVIVYVYVYCTLQMWILLPTDFRFVNQIEEKKIGHVPHFTDLFCTFILDVAIQYRVNKYMT